MISFQKVMVKSRQSRRSVILETLGEYKCDTGMCVENVPAVVNI